MNKETAAVETFRAEQLATLAQLIGALASLLLVKNVVRPHELQHLFEVMKSITKTDHHEILDVAGWADAILRQTGRWPLRPANDT